MDWTEIKIKIKTEDIDRASAIANMAVPYGIYVEDYSDLEEQAWEIAHIDLIEQELRDRDRSFGIIHIYISEEDNAAEAIGYLTELMNADGIEYELVSLDVNDSDWADGWKKFFKCTPVGEKILIRPSWEDYDKNTDRIVLSIDPGAAFGTGTHATTSLCLELLEGYVNENSRVLDIGSGSGILSIGAVLLGAEWADGVDIDAAAVKVAKENAEINGVSDKTNYLVGDLADKISGKYDIVCANIVADVIIRLLENVADYMSQDAVLITSGIIDSREEDVKAGFEKFGFSVEQRLTKENWCAFVCKKN
jgi:ribosomal protein L11 methyltransferase